VGGKILGKQAGTEDSGEGCWDCGKVHHAGSKGLDRQAVLKPFERGVGVGGLYNTHEARASASRQYLDL
jgi:hypothetical protein